MISENEKNALDIIRWCSALAIVICHITQFYDSVIAFILNIGVQIFFFLSGFLYGLKPAVAKNFVGVKDFYLNRLKKVYIPYFLWISIALLILFIFNHQTLSLHIILRQYFGVGLLPGLRHLWFVPVIFVCYLILPLFDFLFRASQFICISTFIIGLSIVLSIKFHPYFIWIATYFVGYVAGRLNSSRIPIMIISIVFSIVLLWDFQLGNLRILSPHNITLHATAGIAVFLLLFYSLSRISIRTKIFKTPGSYELYLTHNLVILSPLTLLGGVTDHEFFNIILALITIVILTMFLFKLNQYIQHKFNYRW